jgi:hypothetical protein
VVKRAAMITTRLQSAIALARRVQLSRSPGAG